MHRRAFVALAACAALPPARADARAPAEVLGEWPAPRLQGQGRLRFLGLHVYDIRLWSPAEALAKSTPPRCRWLARPLTSAGLSWKS